jgi:methylaspartate ammonia-lyase
VSQALLHGVSLAQGVTMMQIIAREYGTAPALAPLPLLCSCGVADNGQLDRMILKEVALLPNFYITDVAAQLGTDGSILEADIAKLSARILERGGPDYRPRLRYDFNGSLGDLCNGDVVRISEICARLECAAKPFGLMLESPVVMRSRVEQIAALSNLRALLRADESDVEIGADEWCNTVEDVRAFADAGAGDFLHIEMPDLGNIADVIEAVIYCNRTGVKACLGGSANETDVSARVAAHIALATRPDHMLARPGLGGDEAVMMQHNEMARALALHTSRA